MINTTQRAAQRRRILLKLETLWSKWDREEMPLGLLIDALTFISPTRLDCNAARNMTNEEIEAKLDTLIAGFGMKVSGG